MNLFNFPIKRPVTIIMGMLMILLVGSLSLSRMPLDLMPKITFPNLMVVITYTGAGPEEVEERVAKPVESAIKSASNIKNVKVVAQENMCLFNAEFNWGTNLDEASADLREKISMVRKYLPDGIDEPVIMRINFQEMPVVFIHVDDPSKRRNLADLADIARDQITPQLERLPGVASAMSMGGLTREIQVNLDRDKMKQFGVTYQDIVNAIRYRNLDMMVGDLDYSVSRFRVRAKSQFTDMDEIGNVIIGNGMNPAERQQNMLAAIMPFKDQLGGQGSLSPIRLKDVAEVEDTFKEQRGLVRVVSQNGVATEGIGMAVMKETDANMVAVANIVKKALPEIEKTLPAGVTIGVSFDLSEFVTDTLGALRSSAIEGGVLAALVIFLFLFRWRPSAIVCLSIPLSLFAAFIAMYFSGYTLNVMTLGAMVIAVGKLVDDSIVVLENTYRHLALGDHPFEAAEKGFREVAVAVTAATLVAVIIFLPIAFTQGLSAQLFRAFAGTVFFALIASLFVSFTVVPMLCSRILKPELVDEKRKKVHVWTHVENAYGRVLAWAVDNYGKVMSFVAMVLLLTGAVIFLMYVQGRFQFVPNMVGGLFQADVKLPVGTVLDETEHITSKIMREMMKYKGDFDRMFMVIGESGDERRAAFMGGEQGMNHAMIMLKMKKFSQGRKVSDNELFALWDRFGLENPNAELSFQSAGSIRMTTDKPIVIKLFGDDLDTLKIISDQIAAKIVKIPGLRDISTSLAQGMPEFTFRFDADKLGAYGSLSGLAINEANIAIGGQMANLYREAGKEYDITVRLKEDERDTFDKIKNIPLSSPMGFYFPLRDVANFEFGEGPEKIERENSKRMVKIQANYTERSMGELVADIQDAIKIVPLPEGYLIEFGGEYQDAMESFRDLGFMFVASILLVYMILAALYESLIHPITMMVAVPLAFTGAIGGLFIAGVSFGVTAFIGIIMLVGIVATNSIVLLDFILEYHRQGMDRREAIIKAGKTRLRPVLMTALTTLFGVLPIALGQAEGMEMQQPLGIVVVGGLLTSTLLTLVVIPVFYELFDDFAIDMKNLFRGKKGKTKI
ncbi:MAG TPA: efflux RND transporter permease subunit [bacterium]|nr:efflux RND transporter permease subunit [bacterium]